MSAGEIASLAASIVAIGIAIVAIWLSVVFYRMTSQLSESTRESAKGIGASVERLEKLFDTLYSDTFSMMRDTVSDMRKHIWPEKTSTEDTIAEETEKRADKKVEALRKDIDSEVAQFLKSQSVTDAKVDSMRNDLRRLVDRAITESRRVEVEAREETLREGIIREVRLLRARKRDVIADKLVDRILGKYPGVVFPKIIDEIEKMRDDGILSWWEGPLRPSTEIELKS